jgi:type IV pilus assembly protein PilF
VIVRRLPAVAVMALALAGCATLPDRVPDDGSSTGQLGSASDGASPADVYIGLAGAYLAQGQLTDALSNGRKAVLTDARNSNAHYVLALVQQRLGQPESADASFRRALAVDQRNPDALNAYGSFLCEQGRYEDADGYFRAALSNPLYQSPWLALHNAGACRQRAGDLAAAETDFRAALRVNPEFAPSLLQMGQISYAKGIYLSARAYLQRYAAVAPHTAESLWLGIKTEQQLGDSGQMAEYSRQLRRQFPDSDQAGYLDGLAW